MGALRAAVGRALRPPTRALTDAGGGFYVGSLFAANEPGLWYAPSDFASLYQDSAGTLALTAVEQPVGLMLDRRLGLVRGVELLADPSIDTPGSWGVSGTDATHIATFPTGKLRYQSGTTTPVLYIMPPHALPMVAGNAYEITMVVSSWTSGYLKTDNLTPANLQITSSAGGSGTFKCIGVATGTSFTFVRGSANVDLTIDSISIRELPGNHASQSTAAARPLLKQTGSAYRIDYDGVDDLHTTTFPVALGAACTVARSIPGVGAQILTGQTIGTSFTSNVDCCALVILDRALTATETTNLTRYLNQKAGL